MEVEGVEVMKMEEEDPELKLSVLGRLRLCGLATLTLDLCLPMSSQLSGEERKAESPAVVPLLPLLPSVPLAEDLCVGSSSPREFPELSVEAALLELEFVFSSSDSSDSTVLSELLYRRSLFLG